MEPLRLTGFCPAGLIPPNNYGIQKTMNNIKVWPVATFAALLIAAVGAITTPSVLAQQPADAPRPASLAPPPPELQNLDEGQKPDITIEKNEKAPEGTITQQRQQGVVTDIKVNSGGSTYHIVPRTAGTSLPGDTPGAPANGARWVIKEFDWGQKKEKLPAPGQEQAVDTKTAPMPPTTPAQ